MTSPSSNEPIVHIVNEMAPEALNVSLPTRSPAFDAACDMINDRDDVAFNLTIIGDYDDTYEAGLPNRPTSHPGERSRFDQVTWTRLPSTPFGGARTERRTDEGDHIVEFVRNKLHWYSSTKIRPGARDQSGWRVSSDNYFSMDEPEEAAKTVVGRSISRSGTVRYYLIPGIYGRESPITLAPLSMGANVAKGILIGKEDVPTWHWQGLYVVTVGPPSVMDRQA